MTHMYAARYHVTQKIGSGAFGDVYTGVDSQTGHSVAIKIEKKDVKHRRLRYEAAVFNHLAGGTGIPRVHWFGTELGSSAMVSDLLGPNLENVFNDCHRRFSLRAVVSLADQLIARLECIHHRHIIHRDLKPENIVTGIGTQCSQVYVIDFGLANVYRDVKTEEHVPYSDKKKLVGTARYASMPSHLGIEQSRRDDVESPGYVLVYLAKGSLPWQGFQASTAAQKENMILQKKLLTSTKDVCSGLPGEFGIYLDYARSLGFKQRPDYSYLRGLFKNLSICEGLGYDDTFDWDRHAQGGEQICARVAASVTANT